MTEAGCPSAAARLIRRPSASRWIRRPSASVNSSTNSRIGRRAARELLERRDVDLDVEVAGVADDGAVLHRAEVLVAQDALVAGDRDEDVAERRRLLHRHHAEAVERRLDRLRRIDLGHDDLGAEAARPHRDAAAAPAVAGDDDVQARRRAGSSRG